MDEQISSEAERVQIEQSLPDKVLSQVQYDYIRSDQKWTQ